MILEMNAAHLVKGRAALGRSPMVLARWFDPNHVKIEHRLYMVHDL